MNTITADAGIQTVLARLKGLTEIRDGQNKVLGYFLPAMPREELLLYLKVLGEYDPEEIKRRKESQEKGYTIEEILEYLESLERPTCATPLSGGR